MRRALAVLSLGVLVALGCAKQSETNTSQSTSATTENATPASQATAPPAATTAGGNTYTVSLHSLNGSNEAGTLTITDVANEAGIHTSTLQLTLSNAPSGKQAVNIYKGKCPPSTLPSIFLEPTVNGKMSHELGGFGIADLKGSVIAVWSTEDPASGKYVSCGEILGK